MKFIKETIPCFGLIDKVMHHAHSNYPVQVLKLLINLLELYFCPNFHFIKILLSPLCTWFGYLCNFRTYKVMISVIFDTWFLLIWILKPDFGRNWVLINLIAHWCEVQEVVMSNKRTDAWWDIFMIWKIDFGLLTVGWAGLWNKRFGPIMSNFWVRFFQLFVGKKKKKLKTL